MKNLLKEAIQTKQEKHAQISNEVNYILKTKSLLS